MFSLRKTIAAGAAAGVAIAALSRHRLRARCGRHRGAPPWRTEHQAGPGSRPSRRGLSFSHAQGSSIGVPPLSQAGVGRSGRPSTWPSPAWRRRASGYLRVSRRTSRPATVRARRRELGRSRRAVVAELVQVAVPRDTLSRLQGHAVVDVVRAPAQALELAVSGEEIGASLAAAWHAKGFTGQGVKVAVIDAGFGACPSSRPPVSSRRTSSRRTSAAASSRPRRGTAQESPRSSTRWRRTRSSTSSASTPRSTSRRPRRTRRARASRSSTTRRLARRVPGRRERPDRRDRRRRPSERDPLGQLGRERRRRTTGPARSTDRRRARTSGRGRRSGNTFVWPTVTEICGFLKWDEWPAGVSDFDLGLFLSRARTT